jgi:hypothetical protein
VLVVESPNQSDDRKPDCDRKNKPLDHMIVSNAERGALLL